jgi:cellulose synthase/poly-beta-1,6-N-acetylglucosamine synthase-like glycosyltransferase
LTDTANGPNRVSTIELSIIVPFHRGLDSLRRCIEAVTPLPAGCELIVAGDAPADDCREVVGRYGGRLLLLPGPNGPAVARNRAAAVATGDVLVFVDADVVASRDALDHVARTFRDHPEIDALFGAYDESPADPGFVSQYKNLAHSYIRQSSATVAQTFWAGFGAVRRTVFESVGGFDERFARPSVEDIDLGYRLTAAGYRVRLDPSLRACHLKRWTLRSMIVSDVRDRGIPWTQLILRGGRFGTDLNLKSSYRACVVLAYLALTASMVGFLEPRVWLAVPVMLGALVVLSHRYYRYFHRQRGVWFVLRVFPLHYLYHLYNGLSFAFGVLLYSVARRTGVAMPGALPMEPWGAVAPSPAIALPDFRSTAPARTATDQNVVGV